MQGGRFTTDDQLNYRSYRCKIQCNPDDQNILNNKAILKQLHEYKVIFNELNAEIKQITKKSKMGDLEPRVTALEVQCESIFS